MTNDKHNMLMILDVSMILNVSLSHSVVDLPLLLTFIDSKDAFVQPFYHFWCYIGLIIAKVQALGTKK